MFIFIFIRNNNVFFCKFRKTVDGLDFIYYIPTPFLPPKTIGFIYGNLRCNDKYNMDLYSLKVIFY